MGVFCQWAGFPHHPRSSRPRRTMALHERIGQPHELALLDDATGKPLNFQVLAVDGVSIDSGASLQALGSRLKGRISPSYCSSTAKGSAICATSLKMFPSSRGSAQQHRDPDSGHGQIKTGLESHGALLAFVLVLFCLCFGFDNHSACGRSAIRLHELTSRTPPSAFAVYPCTVHCRPQRHPRPAGATACPRGTEPEAVPRGGAVSNHTRM